MDFFGVGCLTTEDRVKLVDIIKNIKEEENQELKKPRQTEKPMARSPIARPSPNQRFSSRNTQIPHFPKR